MDQPIINRVASSSIITLNLEAFFPIGERAHFDLKPFLFMELILKEKDFREALQNHDWAQYQDKSVLVYCSADAIIPVWAYMLVAGHAAPFAADIFQGSEEEFLKAHFVRAIGALDYETYRDKRIVVKGCSDKPVPPVAYLEITRRLRPVARSIMYGEPCSTVPIFKQPMKR
jgi:hypothetical protein